MNPAPDLDFLEAREARQAVLQQAFGAGASTLITLGTNIPGPQKLRPGLTALMARGMTELRKLPDFRVLAEGGDLLGPFVVAKTSLDPEAVKGVAVALEREHPAARLLDVDVYRGDGQAVDRRSLGLLGRACLCCAEDAGICIRLQRHSLAVRLAQVDQLLKPFRPPWRGCTPEQLSERLVRGARRELDLTPKPGLVDRQDAGAHPDLSYAKMQTSIALLPDYFQALLGAVRGHAGLEQLVQVGREAESRMVAAIQSNAHKGYLFLSGLLLLGATQGDGSEASLRTCIAGTAARFFAHHEARNTHGAQLRTRLAVGGIRAEAEAGLPSVFEVGLPHYRESLALGWDSERAGFHLMALLMQRVEDTTTLQRGGPEGLARLKGDGATLQRQLERGRDARPFLTDLNADYRLRNLTLGGVADCMALCFALAEP